MESFVEIRGRFWCIKNDLNGYRQMADLFEQFWRDKAREKALEFERYRSEQVMNSTELASIMRGKGAMDVLYRFPVATYGSLYLSLYAYLEEQLRKLCDSAFANSVLKREDLAGRGVGQSCRYLEKAARLQLPGFLANAKQMALLKFLRDRLAHAGIEMPQDKVNEYNSKLGQSGLTGIPGVEIRYGKLIMNCDTVRWFVDQLEDVFKNLALAAGVKDYDSLPYMQ